MLTLKREVLNAQLPAAACTESLRESLKIFAKDHNASESAVIRYALEIFLRQNSGKNIETPITPENEAASVQR